MIIKKCELHLTNVIKYFDNGISFISLHLHSSLSIINQYTLIIKEAEVPKKVHQKRQSKKKLLNYS